MLRNSKQAPSKPKLIRPPKDAKGKRKPPPMPPTVQSTAPLPASADELPIPAPPSNAYSVIDPAHTEAETPPTDTHDWMWLVVGVLASAFVVIASVGTFALARTLSEQGVASVERIQHINQTTLGISSQPAVPTPLPISALAVAVGTPTPDALRLDDGRTIELVPWDGAGRFTVIVAGIDRREGETGLGYRTDTLLLVSVDPQRNSLGVLSLPRDLYVNLPGSDELLRINTPLAYGEGRRTGYGPTLLMQTVQYNLGITVHEHLILDFQVFIDLIDAIGGIEVETQTTIDDPNYPDLAYGYDPFYLPAGRHHLNGYDALRFARTRHGDSDIQRAERQQHVLRAMRERVLRLDMLPSLLLQAPQLWASWTDNVHTGLNLEQMIQLALYLKDVPAQNIHMGVVDYRYVQSYETSRGESVLIPNRAALGALMTEVFGAGYTR